MEDLWKDLSYAWRMLVKSPGFAVIAVLALGSGDRREHGDLQLVQRDDVEAAAG